MTGPLAPGTGFSPAQRKGGLADAMVTTILILLGTVAVAFFPLCIAKFHAAVEDGGLLLVASVYAADVEAICGSLLGLSMFTAGCYKWHRERKREESAPPPSASVAAPPPRRTMSASSGGA